MLEKTLPGVLNQSVLKPYGQLTHFKLDSDQRSAEIELVLNGEVQPLRVAIQRFEIIPSGDDVFVVIHEMITSRAWLTQAARDHVIGKRFKLPANAAKYASMVL